MSPVSRLVAVALTHVFAGTPLCGVSAAMARPFAPVVITCDPSSTWPWPKPDGSGVVLLKNWMRNGVFGRLVKVA